VTSNARQATPFLASATDATSSATQQQKQPPATHATPTATNQSRRIKCWTTQPKKNKSKLQFDFLTTTPMAPPMAKACIDVQCSMAPLTLDHPQPNI
jgi:hypothetical protein